jgi:hypothetical protein
MQFSLTIIREWVREVKNIVLFVDRENVNPIPDLAGLKLRGEEGCISSCFDQFHFEYHNNCL